MAHTGFVAVLVFTAALLALHAANLPEEPQHMSGFVHTSLAPLWILSLCAFALGGIAITMELRRRLAKHRFRSAGITMLLLAAIGALIVAACPVDADPYNRTLLGTIHEDAAPATFLLAATAMMVLAPAFNSAQGWRYYAGMSLILGFFAMVLALAYIVATLAENVMVGLVQRLLVGSIVTWMFLVAMRLLRRTTPEPAPKRKAKGARPTCAI